MHEALVSRPCCRIRRLGGTRAREIQFTRFLRNPKVSVETIAAHAAGRTRDHAAGRRVLALQDTTTLVMGGRRARAAGFGPVCKGGALGGLLLHPVLAVDADTGGVLGLAGLQLWNRSGGKRVTPRAKRLTAQKESQRWLDGMTTAAERLDGAASVTVVGDSENDIDAAFAARPPSVHILTRVAQDRLIVPKGDTEADDGPHTLMAFADALPEAGRATVVIPAAPGRKARKVDLAIRFAPVAVRRPKNDPRSCGPDSVPLSLVDLRETSRPADGTPAVHWRLLTSHPVETVLQARTILGDYRRRWTIEELFRTLKTAGFDIEDTDIGAPGVMMTFAAAVTVASVTIMQLVRARDGVTDDLMDLAFAPEHQPVIEAVSARLEGKTERQRNPHPKGGLAFAAWVVARLGGWTGYYGKPGPKVMRRGLAELSAIIFGATLRPNLRPNPKEDV